MFFFKALWLCMALSLCSALQEEGNCTYKALVSKTCLRRGCLGTCCLGTKCEVSYKLDGKWVSSVEQSPSKRLCSSLCSKHYNTCISKCKCLASREAIKDRDGCKCTPNIWGMFFFLVPQHVFLRGGVASVLAFVLDLVRWPKPLLRGVFRILGYVILAHVLGMSLKWQI